MNPQVFPPNDKSYLNFNRIGERAKGIWLLQNEKAETLFLKWRREYINKETGEPDKAYLPVSYADGKWNNKQGFYNNLPPYYLPELLKTTKPILVVEGETAMDSAEKLFPNYFVTTWTGGCKGWSKINWSWFKGKKDITFWPDNDETGHRAVMNITRKLTDQYNCNCKIVDIPTKLKNGWDLADYTKEDDINIFDLVANAEIVNPHNYEDIESDIKYKRWVFVKKTRKLYYDRFKKEFVHRDTINELYKRDFDLTTIATNKLQRSDCDVVDATAFWPTDKEYLFEDGNKYINTYKAKRFDKLTKSPTKEDIKLFRNHLSLIANEDEEIFNCLEDTIAHDLQFPEVNRLWAVLLQGDFGLGKSILFEVITKLNGNNNVEWVPSYAFAHKFRDWLKKCCVIVCNEFSFDKYARESSYAYGMMRELITETKHFVESKGVDQYQHKGHYKIWLSSNDAVPIKLGPRDRRFFIANIKKPKELILKEDPDYYKNLWAFVQDDEAIKKVFWYYKSVHKVSNEFSHHTPLMTEAKSLLIQEGQDQVFRDLDEMYENKEGPFEFDIVNSNLIMDHVRQKEEGLNGIPNPRSTLLRKIDQTTITEWISYKQGVPLKRNPVSITPNDIERKKKRRYHAIRNQEHWIDCVNLNELRAHMISKVKVAQKEKQLPF